MARSAHNDVLDALLDYIRTNGSRLDVCSTEPTTYAEATTTYTLANTTLATGDSSGSSYTGPTDGDSSIGGRKITVEQNANISITGSDDAEHIAITNGSDTLLFVTTCTLQALTSGGTVTVPAFDIHVTDPVAP